MFPEWLVFSVIILIFEKLKANFRYYDSLLPWQKVRCAHLPVPRRPPKGLLSARSLAITFQQCRHRDEVPTFSKTQLVWGNGTSPPLAAALRERLDFTAAGPGSATALPTWQKRHGSAPPHQAANSEPAWH